ncbi:peptidase M24, structural domain-containing protein [Pisolithus albus]|nr:peptidase M24, structural domain-containing protein [Pisolithus albus]
MVSPIIQPGEVVPKVIVLTPPFEETRAKLFDHPWCKRHVCPNGNKTKIRTLSDSMRFLRHFIVDGFQKIVPGVNVISVPLEITSLRECKSQAELAMLQLTYPGYRPGLLAIRDVQKRMYIGIYRESQVRQLIDRTLAVAGVTDRWALVPFGDEYLGHWFAVQAAQAAAFNTAKEGTVTSRVDEVARKVFAEHGLGHIYAHRLGHGIGLESPEIPYLRGGSDDIIGAGNAFSNEMGVYIEGEVGMYLTAGVGGQALDPLHPWFVFRDAVRQAEMSWNGRFLGNTLPIGVKLQRTMVQLNSIKT